MNGRQTHFLETLFDNLHDGIYQIDQQGKVVAWNRGAERITGISSQSVLGTDCHNNKVRHLSETGEDLPARQLPILATLRDGIRREITVYLRHAEGFRVAALARTLPILDGNNRIGGALEIFTDSRPILAAFQRDQHVEQTVLLDPVTGIGNRAHIERRIRTALDDYRGGAARSFGVLFIDIDHFKDFNDQYGHLTGDKVLRYVANTLRNNVRATDSCGRWGGEEFIAAVLEVGIEGLKIVGEKLRTLVEKAVLSENGTDLKVTVSIGGTIAHWEDTLQSLIKRADELMYESKQAGRNRVTVRE